jgi:hypothetical protein
LRPEGSAPEVLVDAVESRELDVQCRLAETLDHLVDLDLSHHHRGRSQRFRF